MNQKTGGTSGPKQQPLSDAQQILSPQSIPQREALTEQAEATATSGSAYPLTCNFNWKTNTRRTQTSTFFSILKIVVMSVSFNAHCNLLTPNQ